ncbi:hypothetical protein PLICRDRAFT_30891 [Plicaturopsis crispa FD-325 SS-3]|nr:hypothetical protein PLICRDRAFT_30891 [Plicaturopsis crispa FD-325 SS-3]
MMFSIPTFVSALLFAASAVQGAPAQVENVAVNAAKAALGQNFDVVTPHITFPTAGASLPVGSKQNITWDTSSIPASSANVSGVLLLGQRANDSENLDINHPLASQFPLSQGSVEVTIPQRDNADNYIIVLIGDSGNASPEFTITAA